MMAGASPRGDPGESDSRLAGVCGILFGILVIATFAASYNFPADPSQADATLAQFSSLRNAVVAAQAVIGFGTVEVFGFLVFAAGFAVYGFATIRGKPFPRWLGYLGILGAVLFLLGSLPVSGAFTAIFAGVILILVWVFATSVLMWRSGAPRATR